MSLKSAYFTPAVYYDYRRRKNTLNGTGIEWRGGPVMDTKDYCKIFRQVRIASAATVDAGGNP